MQQKICKNAINIKQNRKNMNVHILVLLYIYLQQATEVSNSFNIVTETVLIYLSSCFDIKMARMTEIKYSVEKIQKYLHWQKNVFERSVMIFCGKILSSSNKHLLQNFYTEVINRFKFRPTLQVRTINSSIWRQFFGCIELPETFTGKQITENNSLKASVSRTESK